MKGTERHICAFHNIFPIVYAEGCSYYVYPLETITTLQLIINRLALASASPPFVSSLPIVSSFDPHVMRHDCITKMIESMSRSLFVAFHSQNSVSVEGSSFYRGQTATVRLNIISDKQIRKNTHNTEFRWNLNNLFTTTAPQQHCVTIQHSGSQ